MSNLKLSNKRKNELLDILKERFYENNIRHSKLKWVSVERRLESSPEKLWSLNQMEISGGEPDVIDYDKKADEYIFCDCTIESPKERRNLCYDQEALKSRKKDKPKDSALNKAEKMGLKLLTEKEYRYLQKKGSFDTKTSSWLKTPNDIRELGGAIFGDCRYNKVFIYHNGAESYYSSRGFRCILRV